MLSKLLPQRVDNTYRGRRLALWIFGFVVTMKILQSVMAIFSGAAVVKSADGIPLDAYTPAGAQTVVAMMGLLSVDHLVIASLCVLVLVRYRSLITLMFAVLAAQYLARLAVLHFLPIVRTGTPPGVFVNVTVFVLTILGLSLSVWERGSHESAS